MSSPLNLNLSIEWKEKESDHSNCCECEQIIIGQMWQLYLVVDGEEIPKEDKLCKYCYDQSGEE